MLELSTFLRVSFVGPERGKSSHKITMLLEKCTKRVSPWCDKPHLHSVATVVEVCLVSILAHHLICSFHIR